MGTDIKVVMWCDIHGKDTEAGRTITVGLDGTWREVDLCAKCEEDLLADIGPVLRAGRVPLDVPRALPIAGGKRSVSTPKRKPYSESKMSEGRRRNKLIRQFGFEQGKALGHPEWAVLKPGDYVPIPLQNAWLASVLPEPESA